MRVEANQQQAFLVMAIGQLGPLESPQEEWASVLQVALEIHSPKLVSAL